MQEYRSPGLQTFTEYSADWEFPIDLKERLDNEVSFWGADFINLRTASPKVLSRNASMPYLTKADQSTLIDRMCRMCRSLLLLGVPKDLVGIAGLGQANEFRAVCQSWMDRLADFAGEGWLEYTDDLVLEVWEVWDGSADGPMPAAVLSRESNETRVKTAVTKELSRAFEELWDQYSSTHLATMVSAKGRAEGAPVAPTQIATAKLISIARAKPGFPRRAEWLKGQLYQRGWSPGRPNEFGGPDRKSVLRILSGKPVLASTLKTLADALSFQPHPKVTPLDIPMD